MKENAEEVKSVCVILFPLDNLLIQLGSRAHLSGLVHLEGSGQEI